MGRELQLIRDIQKSDIKAFKQFFESFYPSLSLFANKYVQEKAVANDIAQDAFVSFWERRKDICLIDTAKSYLFTVVKNKSLNYIRDKKKDKTFVDENYDSKTFFSNNIIEEETYRIIYDAVKTLSPRCQQIIELSLDGLKNHEISKKLGISINTVKTLKRRAYKALREKLKNHIFALFIIFASTQIEREF